MGKAHKKTRAQENVEEWSKDYTYEAIKNEFIHNTAKPIEIEIVNNWFK